VSLPEEDLAARGRSIFERLRQEQEPDATGLAPVVPHEAGEEPVENGPPAVEHPSTADESSAAPKMGGVGGATQGAGEATVSVVEPSAPADGEGEPADAAGMGAAHAMRPVDVDVPGAQVPAAEESPHAVPAAPAVTVADAPEVTGASQASVVAEAPADPAAPEEAAATWEAPTAAPIEGAAPAAAGEAPVHVPAPPNQATSPALGEAAVHVPAPPMEARPPAPMPVPGVTGSGDEGEPAATDPGGGTQPAVDPQRYVRPLPRILAIANQKGGVGKTTTTVNLGASLAVLGFRVLVVDLDPQGNATTGLGINSRNLEASIYDVILHDVPLEDCVEATQLRNLFVAPATIDLAGAEIELVPAFSRELRLRRALEDVRADYDFVLIDCPPSLGLLTVNALAAATEVVVPIQCEYYALEGLGQLLRNVNLVQSNLNPKLELSAIVLTMYDGRTKLAEQVADEVRQHFGDKVCRNVVPRTVRLSEAPSFGQPIIVFDPSSRGALAYRELAREVSGGPPQRTG
jgi:chromosome partitioning protein